jgi:hypothetical protein
LYEKRIIPPKGNGKCVKSRLTSAGWPSIDSRMPFSTHIPILTLNDLCPGTLIPYLSNISSEHLVESVRPSVQVTLEVMTFGLTKPWDSVLTLVREFCNFLKLLNLSLNALTSN